MKSKGKIKVEENQVINENDCLLCYKDMKIPLQIPFLKCQHKFCKDCIKKAIKLSYKQDSTITCPMCRSSEKMDTMVNDSTLDPIFDVNQKINE